MPRIELSEQELADLMEELLRRLAADPGAVHLWRWHARPGCDDAPPGPSRRGHLASLLGLLGAAVLPASACSSSTSAPLDGGKKDTTHTDAPGKVDAPGADGPRPKTDGPVPRVDGPKPKIDGPKPDIKPAPDLPKKKELGICGDDPCACADDPCACGDDPCACADDPCP
jgi:hypothetical protein